MGCGFILVGKGTRGEDVSHFNTKLHVGIDLSPQLLPSNQPWVFLPSSRCLGHVRPDGATRRGKMGAL